MGENIAFITDVHGNAVALQAVLQAIDKQEDIKHIYCLGDMIGIGHQTNEVLEALFSRNDISMITGNHDEAILALINGEQYPESHNIGELRNHHEWIVQDLDKSFVLKLNKLSRYIQITIEQTPTALIHYHINHNKLSEHISKDPFSQIVQPTQEHLLDLFHDYGETLICFGHHHPVHFFQTMDKIFLNPGSLGCNHEPFAQYSIVNFDAGKISVELKKVPYDNENFINQYLKLQIPDYKTILKIFYGKNI